MVDAYIQDSLDNPQYAKWNVSSIATVYAAAIGCNGDKAKTLANTLLDDYLSWVQSQECKDDRHAQYVADVIKSRDRALASDIKYQMGLYWTVIPEPDDYPKGWTHGDMNPCVEHIDDRNGPT